jgi:hypothetical protein
MVLYLNPYRNFIDVSMKDRQLLLLNPTDKFELPLVGINARISILVGMTFKT